MVYPWVDTPNQNRDVKHINFSGSLPTTLPVTYIYGETSWMDKPSILEAVDILRENGNKVDAFVSILHIRLLIIEV